MTRHEKLLQKVLRGASDGNIGFDELCELLRRLGFAERQRGGSAAAAIAYLAETVWLRS